MSTQLKFLNLNLYEGGLFFDNILAFLEETKPDIAVFQEVFNGTDPALSPNFRSMEILKRALPDYDSFFAPEILLRIPKSKIDIGNAIFSKFQLTNQQTHFFGIPYGEYDANPANGDFSLHPKNLQLADVVIDNKTIKIGNLHGIWELSGADTPQRLHMSDVIVNQIKDKKNVILAGDFNLKPDTQTIKNLEKYLVNIFKDELQTSFNLKHKDLEKYPGYADAVVDMVFSSPHIKVINKEVSPADVSDHVPLLVTFEI